MLVLLLLVLLLVLEFHSEAAHTWDSDVEAESEILELVTHTEAAVWS